MTLQCKELGNLRLRCWFSYGDRLQFQPRELNSDGDININRRPPKYCVLSEEQYCEYWTAENRFKYEIVEIIARECYNLPFL